MDIIEWIICFLFCAWLLGSVFISAYWFFNPNEWFWKKHTRTTKTIAVGAFLGWFFIVAWGVRPLLSFIPEDWMYEIREGDTGANSIPNTIPTLIGLTVAIFLSVLFGKVRKMHYENRWLEVGLDIEGEIERRRKDWRRFDESQLKQIAHEYKMRLTELSFQTHFTKANKIEQSVLVCLLDELNKRTGSTQISE